MRSIEVTVKGIVPLLQHRFTDNNEVSGESVTRIKSGKKKQSDPEDYLYKLSNGKTYQPAIHFEGSMIKAAGNFQIPGRGKKTYKDLFKAAVFVVPETIIHKHQAWIVDSRSVVNPTTGGRQMCKRPRFDEWELDFVIEVHDDQLQDEAVKDILEYAGKYVGVGAYRPRFGRFMVTKFKA